MSWFKDPVHRTDAAGIAALLAATAAAYFAGLEPMTAARAARIDLTQQTESERAHGREAAATAAELRRRLDDVLAELEASEDRLLSITHQNERLARITALATEMGLTVDQLHPGAPVFEHRYGTVPIRLHARGEYTAMTAFLRKMSESFRDVGVRALDVAGSPLEARTKGGGPAIVLELVWYVLPSDRRG